jgi:ribosome-associated translation inhibitor RaiA
LNEKYASIVFMEGINKVKIVVPMSRLQDVPFYNDLDIKITNYKVAIRATNKDQTHYMALLLAINKIRMSIWNLNIKKLALIACMVI